MRVIKMLGVALLGCAAFLSVGANAQQTSVACDLVLVSSDGPPSGASRVIIHQCTESNGNSVATRTLNWTSTAGYTSCTISTATNIGWTGTCLSPSFYRTQSSTTSSVPSTCTTPGVRVLGGCANSYDSSFLTNPTYLARCGAGCTLEYRTIGWTAACPNSGNGRSPEYGLFCK